MAPDVKYEVSEASSILAMVGQGLGVSVTPRTGRTIAASERRTAPAATKRAPTTRVGDHADPRALSCGAGIPAQADRVQSTLAPRPLASCAAVWTAAPGERVAAAEEGGQHECLTVDGALTDEIYMAKLLPEGPAPSPRHLVVPATTRGFAEG